MTRIGLCFSILKSYCSVNRSWQPRYPLYFMSLLSGLFERLYLLRSMNHKLNLNRQMHLRQHTPGTAAAYGFYCRDIGINYFGVSLESLYLIAI